MLKFSPLIIGTMRLGVWGAKLSSKALEKFIDACLDLGLNDFDYADIYGHYTSESEFGEVLRRRPDIRSKVQITSKCGVKLICDKRPAYQIQSYDLSYKHILTSVDQSLKDLEIECIDLLLMHRPDYLMIPAEIARAFDQLKSSGKVKHFGVSNFSSSQYDMLKSVTPLIENHQVEISLTHLDALEDGILDRCIRDKVIPTAWSPVGGGKLFSNADDPTIQRIQETGKKIGEKHSATLDQILLAWILKHPAGIIPVLGTSKIERVKAAKAALEIKLSHEDWYELLAASRGVGVA